MELMKNIKLAPHTSYKVGGVADYYIKPKSENELIESFEYIKEKKLDFFILGRGSNILVSDSGFRGVVIDMTSLDFTSIIDNRLEVMAGASLTKTIINAVRENRAGMEELAGIPGTVGGAVMMNAGAYNQTISDTLVFVRWLDIESCEIYENSKDELEFGYRYSSFKEGGRVILSAAFELYKASTEVLLKTVDEIQAKRRKSQPLQYPSCGSVFKRPEGNYAGALIQNAGLKGRAVGGAMVSQKHANFIINSDNATANDIRELINICRKEVYKESDIIIEPEVIFLGDFDEPLWRP